MMNAVGDAQSVLVLGGGSEIALACVRRLVKGGAGTVVLAGRDPAAMPVGDVRADRVEAVAFDALDRASHPAALANAWDRAGGDVDLVLVAFGVLGDEEAAREDPEQAALVAETNYVGAVSAILHAERRLREQGHGTIVVLSSVAAERGRRDNPVYGSSKAGLDAFAQGLGDALAGTGVDVLVVRPGFVRTRMTAGRKPAPFSTDPDVVAEAMVRGLTRGAHTVWAPGVLRWVMVVLRHLPRVVWRRLSAG